MHNCLTLVDYTWRDGDESELPSPNSQAALRWRRIARSLDENSSVHGPLSESENGTLSRTRHSFRSDLVIGSERRTTTQTSRSRQDSMLLLSSRQRPTYATSRSAHRGLTRVWAPVGHCRYLLDRDPRTGEIQWSPESNAIVCSPRKLTEVCMARLVRDWPCMLPPRQPSLRNVVNFLFSSRESRTQSSEGSRPNNGPGRRAFSVSSRIQHGTRNHEDTGIDGSTSAIDRSPIRPMTYHDLPKNILNSLLGEAILQRDCAAIAGLVANWPEEQMAIRRLIPPEEFPLSSSYLTKPSFVLVSPETGRGNRTTLVKGPSLMDAFILGLLTRQPACKLSSLDFTGFEEDRRVSIELSRLPILWMKPENRNSEYVRRHLMASLHIGIPRKRLETYFSRIASIYAIHEEAIGRGEPFETVTVHLDCNMTVDEVALGLSLQWLTPFRFSCNRLLLQRLPEIHFPPYSLIRLFDPLAITQFELEDPSLGSSLAVVLPSAVGWLISLRNLRACSLPACIPPPPDFAPLQTSRTGSTFFSAHPSGGSSGSGENWQAGSSRASSSHAMVHQHTSTPVFTSTAAACRLLNRALISLRYLQRLGLARCHLTGQLKILLNGLSQPLEYLNLQDCCLSPEDINFLILQWRPLQRLYELNLSRNNLSKVPQETLHHMVYSLCMRPPGQLVCLSIAYTCLPTEWLVWLVGLMAGIDANVNQQAGTDCDDSASDKWIDTTSTLRVLCLQPFVPPPRDVIHRILHRVARLPKLQRLHLFPAAYAFPADGEASQRELRMDWISHSRNYLRQRSRPDIEVV
ncbi:hypothetical protein CRM22_001666 [Opisthorchis felineus]|uniref:Leucine-rich repeat-containing protein 14 n=1 Tax=Opisthorchis felineus TaxID=147828 RepID=A0A4S2M9R8_OPIFE|nr:hypothetical protein CRM22_001666 [Opisthorchis felineus]